MNTKYYFVITKVGPPTISKEELKDSTELHDHWHSCYLTLNEAKKELLKIINQRIKKAEYELKKQKSFLQQIQNLKDQNIKIYPLPEWAKEE